MALSLSIRHPIRGSRRSNPATYTGMLDSIRKSFAASNGVKPSMFSANSEGACSSCNGAGVIFVDLGFMDTVSTPCEDCDGKGFESSVLEYTFGGHNIAEVMAMPVSEALDCLRRPGRPGLRRPRRS